MRMTSIETHDLEILLKLFGIEHALGAQRKEGTESNFAKRIALCPFFSLLFSEKKMPLIASISFVQIDTINGGV